MTMGMNYESATEGFEDVCFGSCIEIIQEAFDPAVQQTTEGIAGMSISSKRKAL